MSTVPPAIPTPRKRRKKAEVTKEIDLIGWALYISIAGNIFLAYYWLFE